MTRALNAAGISLIKQFESCSLTAYQDIAGVWTQGWGHTEGVTSVSAPVTQEQADTWLADDVEQTCRLVQNECEAQLSDNQFAAVVSLCFNVGSGPLFGKLGRDLESDNFTAAADDFLAWDKAHIDGQLEEVPGLARRRQAERALFLKEEA